MASKIFDNITELPNKEIQQRAASLIGFTKRFERIHFNLRLLLDPEGLKKWSMKHHGSALPILASLTDRYPLVILEGDAGTGKTASAEAIADQIARELKKDGYFIKLSTRVRGEGLHGQMAQLVNDAFERLKTESKEGIAFLLIDEADAIATTRSTNQMHQEEKAAVNTLIQKIDDLRSLKGRAVVMLSTNRLHFLDEAIVRRAAVIMTFERPSDEERRELLEQDLAGVKLTKKELEELVQLTGPQENNGLGYSFSDLRLRFLPEAIAQAYPNQPLTAALLKSTLQQMQPSPAIK
ncbi:AAA family ATPase [Hymenobacter artigasi]|uniref:SpoVK/Ycf46/Vps4 family AAA+-type ATPase n=1 Tax=Hymenobacter artigasi TaxID=2719616 RepID=A0ABX1HMY3_9BACT|nr:ATP-binding protein [Hymenobacter artigasi]NKI91614.1 SpoVK/Ycf46/Vps4 family AAA+-type ATPase [Hymenobacter artigasi]